ncbi:MAG: arsenite efflux transporter metallochaperone ArsD [Actinomycetota bacterium]|nr:arsenite efflux transporter metallochaperone ArsD [Actinomycetota bacterium]
MISVEVYDPALCCSTGVCGPAVDPTLIQFAADADWLTRSGVQVQRFGLVTDPGKFVDGPVGVLLREKGDEALPAVLVGGEVRCAGRYPTRLELADWTGVATDRPGLPLATAGGSEGGCCAPGEC